VLFWLACGGEPPPPDLTVAQIAAYVRSDVKDDRGWASDVRAALAAAKQPIDEPHVCQVLAIVEQESGYDPDPAVPGLGRIVEDELDAELERLGPLAPFGKDALLNHAPDGSETTFLERMHALRTERDVDLLFRDIIAWHEGKAPIVGRAARLFFPRLEERLNPIRTAGSMQVSVSFAQEIGGKDGFDDHTVRDALYTRAGGLRYGTARLFAHEADYDAPIYRFADYNAGLYASRNAELQAILADLTGTPIATDGDLMRYDARGRAADGETTRVLLSWAAGTGTLSESRVRADLRREKERRFEDTETWTALRSAWEEKRGRKAPYAKVPDVALDSPKLKKDLTTRWFAEKVDERYRKCRGRR
jgi:hypothetical protein